MRQTSSTDNWRHLVDTPFTDPIQQEIWATLRALNDAWTQGNPERLAEYFHPDMIAITPVDRLRRDGAAACIAGWQGFAESTRIHSWREIDPLIRVFGDQITCLVLALFRSGIVGLAPELGVGGHVQQLLEHLVQRGPIQRAVANGGLHVVDRSRYCLVALLCNRVQTKLLNVFNGIDCINGLHREQS